MTTSTIKFFSDGCTDDIPHASADGTPAEAVALVQALEKAGFSDYKHFPEEDAEDDMGCVYVEGKNACERLQTLGFWGHNDQ